MKMEPNFLLAAIIVFLTACGVQQDLSESYKLSPGMTMDEVISLLGHPIKTDFNKSIEEWHYCSTGLSSSQFLSLFFHDGILISKNTYTVTLQDTDGVFGSCDRFIKRGTYKVPDEVTEIRLKY